MHVWFLLSVLKVPFHAIYTVDLHTHKQLVYHAVAVILICLDDSQPLKGPVCEIWEDLLVEYDSNGIKYS